MRPSKVRPKRPRKVEIYDRPPPGAKPWLRRLVPWVLLLLALLAGWVLLTGWGGPERAMAVALGWLWPIHRTAWPPDRRPVPATRVSRLNPPQAPIDFPTNRMP